MEDVKVQCAMCELEYDIEEMNDIDEYCICDHCVESFDGCGCSDKTCDGECG